MKSNWETRPLGELVKFSSGGTPSKKNPEYWNGTIPWISAKTMKDERISTSDLMITEDGLASGSKLAPIGSLLLLTRGSGLFNGIPLCIVEQPVAFNQDVKCIESYTDVSNQFIFYWLKSQEQYLKAKLEVTGIGAGKFDTKFLQGLNVPVPPKEERDKIVAIVEALSKKIIVNAKINDNLQRQAATIFRQWFVANPESEKWPLVMLDSLTSLVSRGIAPKYTDDSTQIVLNQKCIRDHYIDISLARQHKPKVINEKWLKYGDLLINSTGEGTLGRAAQVWFIPENMTVDSHVTIVRPKNQLLLFYIGLWGISHEREIEALHTGSTGQTELPRERVKAMELRQPDNDTLARFNSIIKPMVSAIIANQQENTRLASIRDSILPKLMSGEIDVSGIQI